MDKKISELNEASPLDGSEVLPIVQGGETKKINASEFSGGVDNTSITESVSGAYNIDWSEYSNWDLTLTGNTTLTQTNIPTTATEKTITIYVQGDFALTLPTEWVVTNINEYDPESGSQIVVQGWNNGSFNANVNNVSKPNLYIVEPSISRVDTTFSVILTGLNFTPNTTVSISGQTINDVEFVTPTQLKVNITTGSVEGLNNITINNGFSRVFTDVFETSLGDVYIPSSDEWVDITPLINTSTDGQAKTDTLGSRGSASWSRELNFTKDFALRMKPQGSPLGGEDNAGRLNVFELKNVSDDTTVFAFTKREGGNVPTIQGFLEGYTIDDGFNTGRIQGVQSLTPSLAWDDCGNTNKYAEVRWENGALFFYDGNGILRYSYTQVLTENVYLRVTVGYMDIVDIKYIEFN